MSLYPPPHHQSGNKEHMIRVAEAFPLATLVSAKDDRPYATHIPIIYNHEIDRLVAHIDKFNPQVETLFDGAQVEVIFRGPDTYISPSIYTTKQLPTWNYLMVHARGTVSLINDPEAAKETMVAMTAFLEGPKPAYVLTKDNTRMHRAVRYIQAFDIQVDHWEGKFKLSQDKNEQDFENAKEVLLENSLPRYHDLIQKIYKEFKR